MASTANLTLAIMRGDYDSDIEVLYDAVKSRRERVTTAKIGRIGVGTRVVLKGLRPQYLNGLHGTVAEARRTRFGVTIDEADRAKAGKYAYGHVAVPRKCVEVVS